MHSHGNQDFFFLLLFFLFFSFFKNMSLLSHHPPGLVPLQPAPRFSQAFWQVLHGLYEPIEGGLQNPSYQVVSYADHQPLKPRSSAQEELPAQAHQVLFDELQWSWWGRSFLIIYIVALSSLLIHYFWTSYVGDGFLFYFILFWAWAKVRDGWFHVWCVEGKVKCKIFGCIWSYIFYGSCSSTVSMI